VRIEIGFFLSPVELVKQVGVGDQVRVRRREACGLAFGRLVVALRLIRREVKARQQLEQGPAFCVEDSPLFTQALRENLAPDPGELRPESIPAWLQPPILDLLAPFASHEGLQGAPT
jgi:hypothetical protein